jgi:hypothetical protein
VIGVTDPSRVVRVAVATAPWKTSVRTISVWHSASGAMIIGGGRVRGGASGGSAVATRSSSPHVVG